MLFADVLRANNGTQMHATTKFGYQCKLVHGQVCEDRPCCQLHLSSLSCLLSEFFHLEFQSELCQVNYVTNVLLLMIHNGHRSTSLETYEQTVYSWSPELLLS